MVTDKLIKDLLKSTKIIISTVEDYQSLKDTTLNFKASKESWSILECLEHLNLYGDFYNPAIKECIDNSNSTESQVFKSGVLGNYFVNLMLPKEKLNKMKTLKDKNPSGSQLDKSVINRFLAQQKEFLSLIEKAQDVDLTKTKTLISISKFIKLRLGDTLRFNVAHNQRHITQANNVLSRVTS